MIFSKVHAQGVGYGVPTNGGSASAESGVSVSKLLQGLWDYADNLVVGIVVLVVCFVLASVARRVIGERLVRRNANIKNEILILVQRLVQWSIITIGILFFTAIMGLDLALAIAPLSLGIGFAFKDIIANFIGGMVILSENKFKIGDTVNIQDKIGKIEEMDVRTTVLRSFDGTIYVIPNSEILTAVVENYSSKPNRRIQLEVGIHYSNPVDQVISITQQVLSSHPDILKDPSPSTLADRFDTSSIKLKIRFWVETGANWIRIRSDVIQKIQRQYAKSGITIPFPIQTLSLDKYDPLVQKMITSKNPSS